MCETDYDIIVLEYQNQDDKRARIQRDVMAKEVKRVFLEELTRRYGPLRKLDRSDSLYETGNGIARVYVRYSRIHGGNKTWYGLRAEDLQRLEGHLSFMCFLWDDQVEPLLIPFSEYEDVFQSTTPAGDGQFKAMVILQNDGVDLYIARVGRFNVEGHFGWTELEDHISPANRNAVPDLSHFQMQTLLGAIGLSKGYDIWIPQTDRPRLDWSLTGHFECRDAPPHGFEPIQNILQEVDVIWIQRGSSDLRALFEVEHSTPVYSGLLRFNDIHLVAPRLRPRFSIVANDTRRSLYVRQINRPTFQTSGLNELCTFLEYIDVLGWYNRLQST
jgi:hypothetical protein